MTKESSSNGSETLSGMDFSGYERHVIIFIYFVECLLMHAC